MKEKYFFNLGEVFFFCVDCCNEKKVNDIIFNKLINVVKGEGS